MYFIIQIGIWSVLKQLKMWKNSWIQYQVLQLSSIFETTYLNFVFSSTEYFNYFYSYSYFHSRKESSDKVYFNLINAFLIYIKDCFLFIPKDKTITLARWLELYYPKISIWKRARCGFWHLGKYFLKLLRNFRYVQIA